MAGEGAADGVSDGPTVGIRSGAVRGRSEGGLAVFRGIPYAKPPRRFGPGDGAGADQAAREAACRAAYGDLSPDRHLELVMSDWLFRMPSLRLAEAHASAGERTYTYELSLTAPVADGMLGACHGFDIPLVFGILDNPIGGRLALAADGKPTDAVLDVSARMRAAWTAFAATGDPGWPGYDTDTRATLVFDEETRTVDDPERASRLLWRDHAFAPLRPDAADGSGGVAGRSPG